MLRETVNLPSLKTQNFISIRNGVIIPTLKWVKGMTLVLIFSSGLSSALVRAEISKSTKTIIKTSAYGALAGTVLGLASYPAHRSLRGVALGASIGLYLGLAVGAYSLWSASDSGGEAPLISWDSQPWPETPKSAKVSEEEWVAFPMPQLSVAVLHF